MEPIYLDYNATTPIKREVVDAMLPYLTDQHGNPSSTHPYGVATKAAVNEARDQLAALLDCPPGEIIFTGGGSEANNTAIKGIAETHRVRGNHLITSAVEHPAVREPLAYLAQRGFEVTTLPVDDTGRIDLADVANALTPETILVSIMHANNEVGTIQPIAALAELVHDAGALLHVDAAQSVGKLDVRVDALNVDLLTIAGHKFYAPKGIGALYVREGIEFEPLIHGASHENGRRAGTENVPYIVGLGKAAEIAHRDLVANMEHMRRQRDHLYRLLRDAFGPYQMKLNTPLNTTDQLLKDALGSHFGQVAHKVKKDDAALPNTLSVSFREVEANTLLAKIGHSVAASAGAACHADEITVSAVLKAMGLNLDYAMGTIRLSVGTPTTAAEIESAAVIITEAVQVLQP